MATNSLKLDAELGKNLILGSIFQDGSKIEKLIAVVQHAGPQGPQALAQALFIDFQHAKQAIIKNQLPIDPRAWSAAGGVIDQVVKDVCQLVASKLGPEYISPKFMIGVKGFLMKALHDDETGSGGPGSSHVMAEQQPPMPPEAEPPQEAPEQPQGLAAPQQGAM